MTTLTPPALVSRSSSDPRILLSICLHAAIANFAWPCDWLEIGARRGCEKTEELENEDIRASKIFIGCWCKLLGLRACLCLAE